MTARTVCLMDCCSFTLPRGVNFTTDFTIPGCGRLCRRPGGHLMPDPSQSVPVAVYAAVASFGNTCVRRASFTHYAFWWVLISFRPQVSRKSTC